MVKQLCFSSVLKGCLDCVKKMGKLEGTDFKTKTNKGDRDRQECRIWPLQKIYISRFFQSQQISGLMN